MTSAMTPPGEVKAGDGGAGGAGAAHEDEGSSGVEPLRRGSRRDCAAVLVAMTAIQLLWITTVGYMAFWLVHVSH